MFQKIAARAGEVDVGDNRTIPGIFETGSGMRRFVTEPRLDFRAGYTKVAPRQGFKTFFWYDEFWVALEGNATVTAVDRPSGQSFEEPLNPHDLVYIPSGTHITLDVPEDGHFLFFYIAIPASNKHAHWLAAMTPEDVEDVRIRGEYTPQLLEEESEKGKPVTA